MEGSSSQDAAKRKHVDQQLTLVDGKAIKAEKRRKWEAKQARKEQAGKIDKLRANWVKSNSTYAHLLTKDVIAKLQDNHPPEQPSSNIAQLLDPYFDLQERAEKDGIHNQDGKRLFVAEGTETIRILIQQSTRSSSACGMEPVQLESILVKPSVLFDKPVELLADVEKVTEERRKKNVTNDEVTPGFHVLVGSETVLGQVAGFPVSRGALACGVVPLDRDEAWLDKFFESEMARGDQNRLRILAMDRVCDTANVGSMIRCASAFGINVIVVSQDTCDCWYRRAIRVSMGHIFRVPVVRVQDLAKEIKNWGTGRYQIRSYAAVVDTENLLDGIQKGDVPDAWCCVMGNESTGISAEVAQACSQKIRVDMVGGVDSLSVPIACGIIIHGLKEREKGGR